MFTIGQKIIVRDPDNFYCGYFAKVTEFYSQTIVMVDRGGVSFPLKLEHVEAA